jgi:hypothetical protein
MATVPDIPQIKFNPQAPYIAFTTAQPGIRHTGPTNLTVTQTDISTANVSWNFRQYIQESGIHYFVLTVIP